MGGMISMKSKKLILLLLVICIGIVTTYSFAAQDIHYLGSSSVDSGEIRWGGSTKYSLQLSQAIGRWNNLGIINIAPDTIWTNEDLTFRDIYREADNSDGCFIPYSWKADVIELNTYYLDQSKYTAAIKLGVIGHEIGHALGIGDHKSSTYLDTMMYGQTFYGDDITPARSTTGLKAHDISDYYDIHQ